VPTTRKASATLGSATTISRPTSSLAASTRRTASSAAGPSNLGRAGPSAVGGRGVPAAARRPPAASTTRPAVGRAGSRGVSPGMGASGMAQNNVSFLKRCVRRIS